MKAEGPNDLMMTDFKGHFRLRNGSYCYPLTIVDGFSRYILACDALGSSEDAPTRRVFERVFRTYGLPRRILSDNGSPFASAPAWPDSPDFLSGGYGWASESSALFLGGPSKTELTNECIELSRNRPRGHLPLINVPSNVSSIDSVTNTTRNGRTSPSTNEDPQRSTPLQRERIQSVCRRSSIPVTTKRER